MLSIPKNIFESIDKPGRQLGEPNQLDNLNELLDLLDLQVVLLQPGKELFTPWCARIDQAGRMEKTTVPDFQQAWLHYTCYESHPGSFT